MVSSADIDTTAFGPRLAPFAVRPGHSRGRQYAEEPSSSRTDYQRDRDRVIHSAAFRRLKYKTQVFVYHVGDYYRTRLTHSLEVSQIARSIARALALNEDLAEALALAHDLGHTPFGHAGEEALNEALADCGGFDHNAQTLRILTRLEQRYAEFDGLNLTWETLEGVVKHNGPLLPVEGARRELLPQPIRDFDDEFPLDLGTFASAEAQVASLSDDIAYNNHDIDDGLRAGLLALEDLEAVPLVGPVFTEVASRYPGLERRRLVHESIRRLIDAMVSDLIAESRARIAAAAPRHADDIRALGHPVIAFSGAMAENDRALKRFLFARVYRHNDVSAMAERGRRVVKELFAYLLENPEAMPEEWLGRTDGSRERNARVIGDYIAGMTDRYALRRHAELIGGLDSHEEE